MDRCPNCRARITTESSCRRCGMDLDLLLAVEAAAEEGLRQALRRLALGEDAEALRALQASLSLRQDALANRLLEMLVAEARGRQEAAGPNGIPVPDDWYLT